MTKRSLDLSSTAGVVLAGGRSSRFGEDKAMARLHGASLLEHAMRPLADLGAIAVSAKSHSPVAAHARARGLQVVTDDPNGADGPLAGVLAALTWAETLGFLAIATVPCDAPLLPDDLVVNLLAARGGALAAYAETAHGAHPLCAIWDVGARAPLLRTLGAGHPPVRRFLADLGAVAVHFEAADAFTNANTRDVLTALEQRV